MGQSISCRSALGLLLPVMISCTGDAPLAPDAGPPVPTAGNTLTLTESGVSPQTVQIEVGERVIFVNNDDVAHEMSSDEHPVHLDCPAINQVGFLRPGEMRETGNFVRAETCSFHDHRDAGNAALRGTIVIIE